MQGKTPLFVAALLTWIAGFVDAVGFLALGQIYTANMSGNSVSLGIHLSRVDWQAAAGRAWPVGAYLAGLLFSRLLIQFGARREIRNIASLAIVCELALLAPVWMGRPPFPQSPSHYSIPYVGLLAASMGIQNAALTRFSLLTLHTGFVTGTLVKLAEEFAKYLTWLWDNLGARTQTIARVMRDSFHQKAFHVSVWLGAIWVTYVVGAVGGALATAQSGLKSLAVPIVLLCIVIAVDVYRPLGLRDEQVQSDLSR